MKNGSFQFTQIFDNLFPEGEYRFSIDDYVKSFILHKSTNQNTPVMPDWIKNNAKWWYEGLINDSDFVKGIQYIFTVQNYQSKLNSKLFSFLKNIRFAINQYTGLLYIQKSDDDYDFTILKEVLYPSTWILNPYPHNLELKVN